jgi:hypothetical protein
MIRWPHSAVCSSNFSSHRFAFWFGPELKWILCRLGKSSALVFLLAVWDIEYNCILGRPFLLKFMAIIHTTYATIKMPDPKGIITIMSNQCNTLACENVALSHAG